MKNLIIYSIISSLLFISCNGQDKKNEPPKNKNVKKVKILKEAPYNITEMGDGVKFKYDTLSPQYILSAQETLKDNGFNFPTEHNFESKIKDVFDFDINLPVQPQHHLFCQN